MSEGKSTTPILSLLDIATLESPYAELAAKILSECKDYHILVEAVAHKKQKEQQRLKDEEDARKLAKEKEQNEKERVSKLTFKQKCAERFAIEEECPPGGFQGGGNIAYDMWWTDHRWLNDLYGEDTFGLDGTETP